MRFVFISRLNFKFKECTNRVH